MTRHGEALSYFKNVVLPYRGEECLIWPYSRTPDGYTSMGYDGRTHTVSEIACTLTYGPRPTPQHQAAHKCGNGKGGCCAPGHVRWATPAENAADKFDHGTSTRGEGNHAAKLTEAEVAQIREMRGISTQSAVARLFGVSPSQVSYIQSGKRWKHTGPVGAVQ